MGIKHKATKTTESIGLASEWNDDHEFTSDYDCEQKEAHNFVVENRTDFPAGPVEGQLIYRTDQHTFYHWNNTRWVSMVGLATIVVAADGSGDTIDIQEGIDMLPAGGGVVYIKEGTYTLTAPLTITSNNVSLIGTGFGTQITTGLAIDLLQINAADTFYISQLFFNGNAWSMRGIEIINSDAGKINDCWFSGNATGIYLDGNCDYVLIMGNHFAVDSSESIYVDGSLWININDNWFQGSTIYSIFADLAVHLTVSNNQFWGQSSTEVIYLTDCTNCVIDGNLMEIIQIGVSLDSCDVIAITGNTIRNPGDQGIKIDSCEEIACSGNVIYSGGDEGIYILDSVRCNVTGGLIIDSQKQSIKVESCSNINITGNTHYRAGLSANNTFPDIDLTDDGGNWTTRCIVSSNRIDGKGAANQPNYGVSENNVNDDFNIILGNNITNCAIGDLQIQGANSEVGHNI